MSHVLIAYASHFGQTEKIATRLAEQLGRDGHEVVLANARTGTVPPPESFDLVVLGSRIEMAHHAKEICGYIRAHRAELDGVPTAFFSVSNAASQLNAGPDPNGYLASTFDEVGWKPTRSVAFGGALPYRKYGWLMRFMMKRISRAGGHTTDTSRDHEMTDWNAVERFGEELASMTRPELAVSRM